MSVPVFGSDIAPPLPPSAAAAAAATSSGASSTATNNNSTNTVSSNTLSNACDALGQLATDRGEWNVAYLYLHGLDFQQNTQV